MLDWHWRTAGLQASKTAVCGPSRKTSLEYLCTDHGRFLHRCMPADTKLQRFTSHVDERCTYTRGVVLGLKQWVALSWLEPAGQGGQHSSLTASSPEAQVG